MSTRPTILFVDDDAKAGALFARFAADSGLSVEVLRDSNAVPARLDAGGVALVVTDLRMPGLDGIGVLRAVRERDPDLPVLIITGYSTVDDAIEALRLGASNFIKKPYDADELLIEVRRWLEDRRLRSENRLLRRQLKDERLRYRMVGRSPAIRQVQAMIDKVAGVRCNVIVEGESGTGKELVARAIHDLGPEPQRPFIVIDCGALTDTLLESELFGHERGAFTGAERSKQGLLEAASGGTVFLDEIGNVSDALQTKLLRVVQEQQVTRVGGVRPTPIDVRFIVATHRNLEAMVAAGEFRHDLYHRLNVVKIEVPALRERGEDIAALAQSFVEEIGARFKREVGGFDAASMQRMLDYDWPGNVRELRNLVERHVALADGPVLSIAPEELRGGGGPRAALDADAPDLATLERRYILATLDRHGGNRERTAEALGINKSTLWRRLRQYAADGEG